ncbi:MAG: acetyltransferase [Lentisphaerae bacterium]|nr:acetyltransferase [Lentisphaerota bacterium]
MNKKTLTLLGAGGHARSLIDMLESCNFKINGVFDDTFKHDSPENICGIPLAGGISDIGGNSVIVISIGDPWKRKAAYEKYLSQVLKDNVSHPSSIISRSASLGRSNQIFARTVINSCAVIGDDNVINTGAIIEHETEIGSHNHISVGSIICGRVKIGDLCFIGAGAVVIDKIRICGGVTIGANSVVIEDIGIPGTYIGNPARKIK